MRISYGIPKFLIVENFVDAGGPSAQAVLDALGGSRSFASFPYPGDNAIKAPGLFAFATGTTPPGYPLYASAANPTQPEQAVGDPGGPLSLSAKATGSEADGLARAGTAEGSESGVFRTRAHAHTVKTDDDVKAEAESVLSDVVVGPLSISTIRSAAVTTYRPGSEDPATRSELVLEGGKAGSVTFDFGREGLRVADKGIPLPAEEGLAAINQALAPAGISVRFVEPTPLKGGAVAAVFEIASTQPVPGAGEGTLRIQFGGATSSVSLGEALPGLSDIPAAGGVSETGPEPSASDAGQSSPTPTASAENGTAPHDIATGAASGGASFRQSSSSLTGSALAPASGAGAAVTTPVSPTANSSAETAASPTVAPASGRPEFEPSAQRLLTMRRSGATARAAVGMLIIGFVIAAALVAWTAKTRFTRWTS
ncbi:MAG TPA: hypothetical protein VHL53_11495 [Acidimicrobiia bacterium]|nr:hypothetical protein [Acidimicrobiia bacterium]